MFPILTISNCFWTHSEQDSISTAPKNCPHQSHSALDIAPSTSQCPWSSFYWPTSSFWQWSLPFWQHFVHLTSRTTHLPGFPGCLTDHLFCWLPQSLLLIPSHLLASRHWSPWDSFLGTLFFCLHSLPSYLVPIFSTWVTPKFISLNQNSYLNSRVVYPTAHLDINIPLQLDVSKIDLLFLPPQFLTSTAFFISFSSLSQ